MFSDFSLGTSSAPIHTKLKIVFFVFVVGKIDMLLLPIRPVQKRTFIRYVKKLEEHHKTTTFKKELIALLDEHGVQFDEKQLE